MQSLGIMCLSEFTLHFQNPNGQLVPFGMGGHFDTDSESDNPLVLVFVSLLLSVLNRLYYCKITCFKYDGLNQVTEQVTC